ncbi:MAG: hypothetical protein GY723_21580 [bacterium]|nr:hypothetical protein [bacterium]MCP5065689.1 hypothetical protein [bacterium]
MDLDELVAVTRIPRRSLERLESGAFDGLSDGFVRGFVRTVAQAIGLDPDEAVARLLVEPEFDPRRRWPRAPVLIAIAVGLGMLAAIGAVVTARLEPTAPSDPSGPSAPAEVVTPDLIRRDPVRALAEE